MRSACPGCDLGEAQFKVWISQQQRKDLALLLGAQDRQEDRRRLSIHNLKDTLQFADTGSVSVYGLGPVRLDGPTAGPERE